MLQEALELEVLSPELRQRLSTGEWKASNIRVLEQAISGGDKVVEIGSGIGVCTQAISRMVAPGGVVVGFEPDASLYQIAMSRTEDCEHTLILPVAVGLERGTCRFDGPSDEPWRCLAVAAGNGRIPMHSLADDVLGGRTRFNALVLDAEGAEHYLLRVDVAKHGIRTIVCEIHGDDSDVTRLLGRMGKRWKLETLTTRDPWDNVCAWWTRKSKAKVS